MALGRSSARRRTSRMRQMAAMNESDENDGTDGRAGSRPTVSSSRPFRSRRRDYMRDDGRDGGGRGGGVWRKLGMKLFTYAVVAVLLRRNSRNGKGGGSDGQQQRRELPKFLKWLEPILHSGGEGDGEAVAALDGVRVVRAGSGGGGTASPAQQVATVVHVAPDFLPPDVAGRWRDGLAYEWNRGLDGADGDGGGGVVGKGSSFAFSSAPSSSVSGVDVEVAGSSRNATALAARLAGRNSMSRWELEPAHPLTAEIRRTLGGADARRKIWTVLGKAAGAEWEATTIAEANVTNYAAGDFLFHSGVDPSGEGGDSGVQWHAILSLSVVPSAHDDGAVGNESEKKDMVGGMIRFACPPLPKSDDAGGGDDSSESLMTPSESESSKAAGEWCETVRLDFNTAVIFATGSDVGHVPRYEVVPLEWKDWVNGFRHFGVAASYNVLADKESDKQTGQEQEL